MILRVKYRRDLCKLDDEIINVLRFYVEPSGLFIDFMSSNGDGTFFPETICLKDVRYFSVYICGSRSYSCEVHNV